MLVLAFSLRFKDGQFVTATIAAQTTFEDATVYYSGPLARLPLAPAVASAIEMRAYWRSFARELGARFSEEIQPTGNSPEPGETLP